MTFGRRLGNHFLSARFQESVEILLTDANRPATNADSMMGNFSGLQKTVYGAQRNIQSLLQVARSQKPVEFGRGP